MIRIGIVKVGSMGDVLMTTPFLRQLRGGFPDAEIHYHVGSPSAAALEGNPDLDRIISFDPKIFYEKRWKQLGEWMRAVSQQNYDYLFILDKKLPYAIASRLIRRKRCLGFARSPLHSFLMDEVVPYGRLRHEVHYYLDLLKPLFEPDYDDGRMRFGPSLPTMADIPLMEDFPAGRPFDVWVNSGGINAKESGGARRLPPELFRRLLEHHVARGPVVLLGSAGDGAYYESALGPVPVKNWAGKLTLAQSTAVMQMARSVITTDCGAMHLAGCVQDRVIAFFGPTHPARKLPLSGAAVAIWHDEEIYDDRYEVYGTSPNGAFFHQEDLIFKDFAALLEKF
jgi:ADP-heptose:LPS heptosyltransferase